MLHSVEPLSLAIFKLQRCPQPCPHCQLSTRAGKGAKLTIDNCQLVVRAQPSCASPLRRSSDEAFDSAGMSQGVAEYIHPEMVDFRDHMSV